MVWVCRLIFLFDFDYIVIKDIEIIFFIKVMVILCYWNYIVLKRFFVWFSCGFRGILRGYFWDIIIVD